LIWPTLIFGLVLLIWCLVKPEELMTGFVVALSLFFIAFGLSVFLLNKRAEFSPQAITAAKDFCKSIEGVIHKEKHLRKLDHAVRVLILIDALKVVKRICNLAQTTEQSPQAIRKAKQIVNKTVDKLRQSMQLDVTKVIDEIA
jgi:hypothetical protein